MNACCLTSNKKSYCISKEPEIKYILSSLSVHLPTSNLEILVIFLEEIWLKCPETVKADISL